MTAKKEKKSKNKKEITQHIRKFNSSLKSLRDYIELVEPLLFKEAQKHIQPKDKHLSSFLAAHYVASDEEIPDDLVLDEAILSVSKDEHGSAVLKFTDSEHALKTRQAIENYTRILSRPAILYQTSLMLLVSSTEMFWSDLLHEYFKKNPYLVTEDSDKKFTYRELQEIGSIEKAKDLLVAEKIEKLLWGSFEGWVEFIQKKMKLDISCATDICAELEEVFLRRNLKSIISI